MLSALRQRKQRWLSDIRSRGSPFPRVRVIRFRPSFRVANFGDELGEVLVHLILAAKGMTLNDEAEAPRSLLTVGSIMHMARDGDVIWGTGVNGKVPRSWHRFGSLDVRAVRGPRTFEFLKARGVHVPEIFGDPGLLLSRLAPGFTPAQPGQEIGFVPNLNDLKQKIDAPLPLLPISPLAPWHRVVESISRCRLVLSSSLHGIIIAESLGIPARHVRISDREALFKYQDYYEGTGRFGVRFASSVSEALEQGGEELPDLTKLDAMFDAFPYDLWTSGRKFGGDLPLSDGL